jgi:hypothetical protein
MKIKIEIEAKVALALVALVSTIIGLLVHWFTVG